MTNQQYESYWKLTLAYSDIYGDKFNGCLRFIVDYIDNNRFNIASNPSDAYSELQSMLRDIYKIDAPSIRKAINQFIKLGFVESGLDGYHTETRNFLNATNEQQKKTLFSKIVYDDSSFDKSFDKESDVREINFFIKTLEANRGVLSKEEAMAIMTIDIATLGKDHASANDLAAAVTYANAIGFNDRKYNQVRYFWGLLKDLDDLAIDEHNVYFVNDPRVEVELPTDKSGRDSYLQKIYKNQLKEESMRVYGNVVCMADKLDHLGMIASHIKPYSHSTDEEAFDPNNGLLLSMDIDIFFDKGYMTFNDKGAIIVSESRGLSDAMKAQLSKYSLDSEILNDERRRYMAYHREHVFVK